jgi:hypothetical protein
LTCTGAESEHMHRAHRRLVLEKGRAGMENRLRLRLSPFSGKRRCAPTLRSPLRRRRRYVVTFEHGAEPLRLKAADLREVRAYLRLEQANRHIASIRDELGNLAGCPPTTARIGAGRRRLVMTLLPVILAAAGYGLSWLLTGA